MAKPKKRKNSVASSSRVKNWLLLLILILVPVLVAGFFIYKNHRGNNNLNAIQAQPFFKLRHGARPKVKPLGLVTPSQVKNTYHLSGGGSGTIAIIDAYDHPTAEADLNKFSTQYGLAACTTLNGCFEKHKMATNVAVSSGWALEEALDVQWAHAVAPTAKILLVEAQSASINDLLSAVNYARSRSDVVSVSMSWGSSEFSSEARQELNFTSNFGATFFASSGDSGHGTSWPAASANVIGVGGTTLNYDSHGNFVSETAWSGSGGGQSRYISEPGWQTTYNVPQASHRRAVPDVSYNADPNSGVPVYDSTVYQGYIGWWQVGGTSAGAPQWAAINAISHGITNTKLYVDAKVPSQTKLRDIVNGINGRCGFQCIAQTGYNYVTGLGSPLTVNY